jgi:hypothetical protein
LYLTYASCQLWAGCISALCHHSRTQTE